MTFRMSILVRVNTKRLGHLGIVTGNKRSWVSFQLLKYLEGEMWSSKEPGLSVCQRSIDPAKKSKDLPVLPWEAMEWGLVDGCRSRAHYEI